MDDTLTLPSLDQVRAARQDFTLPSLDEVRQGQLQAANERGRLPGNPIDPEAFGNQPAPYGNWLSSGLKQGIQGVVGGAAGIPRLITGNENAPGAQTANAAAGLSSDIDVARQQGGEGWLAQQGRGIVGSAATMGIGTAAGAIAKAPLVGGIAAAAAQQANQSYNEARKRGQTHEAANAHARTQGLIEGGVTALFNMVGMGGAEKTLADAFKKDFVKSVTTATLKQGAKAFAKTEGKELLEEETTSWLQAIDSKLRDVDPNALTPESLFHLTVDTAAQTLGMTGMAFTPHATVAAWKAIEEKRAKEKPAEQPAPVQTPAWAAPAGPQAQPPAEPAQTAIPQQVPPQAANAPQIAPQEAPSAEPPQAPAEAPTPLEVPPQPVHNPAPQIVERGGEQGPLKTLAEKQPETLPAEKRSLAKAPPMNTHMISDMEKRKAEEAAKTPVLSGEDPIIRSGDYRIEKTVSEIGHDQFVAVPKSQPIPKFDSYEAAEKSIEDFTDEMDKKYGTDAGFNAPLTTHSGGFAGLPYAPTPLSRNELGNLRAMYIARDRIGHVANEQMLADAIRLMPDSGPVPKAEADRILKQFMYNEKLSHATGSSRPIDKDRETRLLDDAYNLIAHKLQLPHELLNREDALDILDGRVPHSFVNQSMPGSIFEQSRAAVRQASEIVAAAMGREVTRKTVNLPGAQPEMFGGSEAQGKLFNAPPAPKAPAPPATKTESPADITIAQPTIEGQKELPVETKPLAEPLVERRKAGQIKAKKTRLAKDEELTVYRAAHEHGVPVDDLTDYVDAEIQSADQHWQDLKEVVGRVGNLAPGQKTKLAEGDQDSVPKLRLDELRHALEHEEGALKHTGISFDEAQDALKNGLPEKPSAANRELVDRAAKRLAEDLEKHGNTEFNPSLFDDISFAKGEFPELETSAKITNKDVFAAMQEISPTALKGTLVGAKELRAKLKLPKAAFDNLLLKMSQAGQVSLHKHDDVANLTPAEVADLIEADGKHYVGAAIRVPEKGSFYNGASPGVQLNKAQARELVRKDLGIKPEDIKGTPESIDDIRKTLEHDFDTALLRGRVPEQAKGFYDWATEVGRLVSKAYQDLAIIAHEITHHFQNTSKIESEAPADVQAEWETLDYDPDRNDPREGFAEFGRYLLTTDEAPNVAPRAYAWFTQKYLPVHPEEQAKWAKARRLIDAYRSADPIDRARANIFAYGQRAAPVTSKKEQYKEELKRQLIQQARNWIDDTHLTKKLGAEAEAKVGTQGRTKLKDLIESYGGADESQAVEALTEGVYSLGEQRKKMYKPLKEVMAPLSREELPQWVSYLDAVAAKEAREKKAGYNPGISEADQDAIIDGAKKAGLADRFDAVAKDFRGFHAALVDVLADSGVISHDSAKRIKDSREVYMPRLRIKDSGLRHRIMSDFHDISRSIFGVKNPIKRLGQGSNDPYMDPIEATVIRTMETYNAANHQEMESAFMRLMLPSMGGAKGFGKWVVEVMSKTVMEPARLESMLDSLTKKHEVNGVERAPVLHPDEATRIKNVSRLRRRDITKPLLKWFQDNYGTQDLAALEKATESVPDIADSVAIWRQDFGEKPNEHIKRFYVDGKAHLAQYVDGDLYSEVQGLSSRYEAATLGKTLSGLLTWYDKLVTTPVKLGAVGLNVSFQPVNFLRDYVSFVNQSKQTGAWERFYAPIEGLARYGADYVRSSLGGQRNPYAELFDALGGKVSPSLGSRRKAVKHLKAEMLAKTTGQKLRAKFAPGNIINSIQDVLSIGESGVRLSEFMGAIHNADFHYDYKQDAWVKTSTGATVDALPRRVVTAASTAANEVTTNFRRKGTYSRVGDRVIPFFSANINGTVRGLLGAKELFTGEGKHKRLLGMAMLLTFGGLAWGLSHDKDWYKDLDPEMKNRFWFFGLPDGTPFLRLAKPYGYSAFVNTMEALLDFFHTGSLDRFPEVIKSEVASQIPPLRPAGISTVWELQMNEDRFGRKIEPLSMVESGLYKQYREKPYTTGTAKFASKFLSSGKYGISPAQADYIADQWTGGSFSQYTSVVEGKVRFETFPVLKRFLLKSDHQATVSDFYQSYEELSSAVATAKYLNPDTKRPDAVRQAQLQQWTRYKAVLSDIWKADRGKTIEEQRELERFAVGMADFALGKEERKLYPNPLRKTAAKVPEVIEQARTEYVGKLAHVMTESPKRKMGEPFNKFRDRFMLSAVETKWAAQELDRLGYRPIDVAKTLDAQMRKSGHKVSVESVGEIMRAMATR